MSEPRPVTIYPGRAHGRRPEWYALPGPLPGTPPRRPGSVRRTTTVDGHRPDGAEGDVILTGKGRDLVTLSDGRTEEVGTALLEVRAGVPPHYPLREIRSEAHEEHLSPRLVGRSAKHGFRGTVRRALAGAEAEGSILRLLLDEVAITTSLSRLGLTQSGRMHSEAGQLKSRVGICSGFRAGGAMADLFLAGQPTAMTTGVPAPPDVSTDELAWHPLPPLPPFGFRRRRLLDVWRSGPSSDDPVLVDGTFRDAYLDEHGVAMVMHEYTLQATVDPRSWRVLACRAQPRMLPGPECHFAADSAGLMVGAELGEIDALLRDGIDPEQTCTHLNDHLRALVSLEYMVDYLPEAGPSAGT